MQRLEHRRHSGYGPAPWTRSRRAPAATQSVYEDLLGQLLGPLQRRRRDAQRILDELARRRAAMSRLDGSVASQSLRAQAVQIRNELARLSLVESLTRRILQPLASRDGRQPRRRSTRSPASLPPRRPGLPACVRRPMPATEQADEPRQHAERPDGPDPPTQALAVRAPAPGARDRRIRGAHRRADAAQPAVAGGAAQRGDPLLAVPQPGRPGPGQERRDLLHPGDRRIPGPRRPAAVSGHATTLGGRHHAAAAIGAQGRPVHRLATESR